MVSYNDALRLRQEAQQKVKQNEITNTQNFYRSAIVDNNTIKLGDTTFKRGEQGFDGLFNTLQKVNTNLGSLDPFKSSFSDLESSLKPLSEFTKKQKSLSESRGFDFGSKLIDLPFVTIAKGVEQLAGLAGGTGSLIASGLTGKDLTEGFSKGRENVLKEIDTDVAKLGTELSDAGQRLTLQGIAQGAKLSGDKETYNKVKQNASQYGVDVDSKLSFVLDSLTLATTLSGTGKLLKGATIGAETAGTTGAVASKFGKVASVFSKIDDLYSPLESLIVSSPSYIGKPIAYLGGKLGARKLTSSIIGSSLGGMSKFSLGKKLLGITDDVVKKAEEGIYASTLTGNVAKGSLDDLALRKILADKTFNTINILAENTPYVLGLTALSQAGGATRAINDITNLNSKEVDTLADFFDGSSAVVQKAIMGNLARGYAETIGEQMVIRSARSLANLTKDVLYNNTLNPKTRLGAENIAENLIDAGATLGLDTFAGITQGDWNFKNLREGFLTPEGLFENFILYSEAPKGRMVQAGEIRREIDDYKRKDPYAYSRAKLLASKLNTDPAFLNQFRDTEFGGIDPAKVHIYIKGFNPNADGTFTPTPEFIRRYNPNATQKDVEEIQKSYDLLNKLIKEKSKETPRFRLKNHSQEIQDRYRTAYEFAKQKHEEVGQKRKYSGEPYIAHPERVASLMISLGFDGDIVDASILHDTLEDTKATEEDLDQFGEKTKRIVLELTNVYTKENYPDLNRNQREELELKRLSNVSSDAQSVKLADRINNLQEIIKQNPQFARDVYVPESEALLQTLTKGDNRLRNLLGEVIENYKQGEDTDVVDFEAIGLEAIKTNNYGTYKPTKRTSGEILFNFAKDDTNTRRQAEITRDIISKFSHIFRPDATKRDLFKNSQSIILDPQQGRNRERNREQFKKIGFESDAEFIQFLDSIRNAKTTTELNKLLEGKSQDVSIAVLISKEYDVAFINDIRSSVDIDTRISNYMATDTALGSFDGRNGIMFVSKEMTPDIFLHELAHAFSTEQMVAESRKILDRNPEILLDFFYAVGKSKNPTYKAQDAMMRMNAYLRKNIPISNNYINELASVYASLSEQEKSILAGELIAHSVHLEALQGTFDNIKKIIPENANLEAFKEGTTTGQLTEQEQTQIRESVASILKPLGVKPEETIEFVDAILENPNAIGMYKDMLIKIVKGQKFEQAEKTTMHEVFHLAFSLMPAEKKKKDIRFGC